MWQYIRLTLLAIWMFLNNLFNPVDNMSEYGKFLDKLQADKYQVVLLCDFDSTRVDSTTVLIGIRHDIDHDLDRALDMARLESRHDVYTTYFVLHTARYYNDKAFENIKKIQDYGHEIGFHNDLYTLKAVKGMDMEKVLINELARFKRHGIEVVGTSAHGSSYRHMYDYSNLDVWEEITMTDYFKYEAYSLTYNKYFSDCQSWRYKMPALEPGDRVIFLAHPRRVR